MISVLYQLKADVASIKTKLEVSNQNITDLNEELAALRINDAKTKSPTTSMQNMNTKPGGGRCGISKISICPNANNIDSRDSLKTVLVRFSCREDLIILPWEYIRALFCSPCSTI